MNYIRYFKIGLHKLIHIALLSADLYLMISSIVYYNTWPIYTSTEVIPQQEAQFPAVTFCNQANGYKETVLKVRTEFAIFIFFKLKIYRLIDILYLHMIFNDFQSRKTEYHQYKITTIKTMNWFGQVIIPIPHLSICFLMPHIP